MNLHDLRAFVEDTKNLPGDTPILQVQGDLSFASIVLLRVVEARKFHFGEHRLGSAYHVDTSAESFGVRNAAALDAISDLVPVIEVV